MENRKTCFYMSKPKTTLIIIAISEHFKGLQNRNCIANSYLSLISRGYNIFKKNLEFNLELP